LTAFNAGRCRTEPGKLKTPYPPCIDLLAHHWIFGTSFFATIDFIFSLVIFRAYLSIIFLNESLADRN